MKFVDEFKDFISRGNVVDMAVGVVVGGAFKKHCRFTCCRHY